jgi:hypothetical protein
MTTGPISHDTGEAAGTPPSPTAEGQVPSDPRVNALLPGHRFIACLRRVRGSETWMVQGPGDRSRYVKVIHGLPVSDDQVRAASCYLQSLDHPLLVRPEIIPAGMGRVFVVSDPFDSSLKERFDQCRQAGREGIPRQELLTHLRPLAEALDALKREHQVQHLGLNPTVVLFQEERVRLEDFGLAQLLWLNGGQAGARNGFYSAPELFEDRLSPHCDQYSLATLYQELITGLHPLHRCSVQRLRRGKGDPDLALLSSDERSIIAQAMCPDPTQRLAGCTDLIQRLEAVARQRIIVRGSTGILVDRQATASPNGSKTPPLPILIALPAEGLPSGSLPPAAPCLPTPGQVVQEMLARAAGPVRVERCEGLTALLQPGVLLQAAYTSLGRSDIARLRYQSLCETWQATPVRVDEHTLVLHVPMPGNLWQRLLGRTPALQVHLHLLPQRGLRGLTEVSVQIRPLDCTREQASLLERYGPRLLQAIVRLLPAVRERRGTPRIPFAAPVQVFPVGADLELGEVIACQGRDISRAGMGLLLPHELSAQQVYIHPELGPPAPPVAILGRFVRVRQGPNGVFEAGAMLPGGSAPGTTG